VAVLNSHNTPAQQSQLTQSRAITNPSAAQEARDPARLTNLGAAAMNQQRFADAEKLFEQAIDGNPNFVPARVNLGIALLGQQKLESARDALESATRRQPSDPYGWYNLGLVYKSLGEIEKAIDPFRHAAELAPADPDTFYFLGLLYSQQEKYDDAIAAFEHALGISAFHASAEFGLARACQRKGDLAAAREHQRKFQRIVEDRLGTPLGAGYGEQGRYSLAELVRSAIAPVAAIPVRFEAQPVSGAVKSAGTNVIPVGPSTGACFFDYNGDGRPDLFLVGATSSGTSHLLRNLGNGHFEDVSHAAHIGLTGSGLGCAAGDFDNDGHTDLAVCTSDGVHLLRNRGDGTFEDVTKAVGILSQPGCVSLAFVDYDHDGDLDLYVVQSPQDSTTGAPPHNFLWRNNGNSTFTDVSAETGLGILATGGGVVASDINNDRAIDFVLPGAAGGAAIYLNPREGKFTPLPGINFAKEGLPPAVGAIAFDFDKYGWMDLAFTHAGVPGLSLWRNVNGKQFVRVPLPDFGWQRGWGLAALDYDNDGWLDLVAAGESVKGGELRLLRNGGPAGWTDVSADVHLNAVKLEQPRAVAVADYIGNGSSSLIVTQLGGPPIFLRNIGGNQHNWMRIDLKALADNKNAIGTKVELYAGALYQKWEVSGASGYLSQSATPILAGLGTESRAEVLRLLWPTGVPQDEVNLVARKTQIISELDRRGSSCPVLFAWNGHEYGFIADMIGAGVVGHWVAPGERDVPNPTEYLKIAAKSIQLRDGLLSLRFLEPMEETVYLDRVRLLAIDHPVAFAVYPNDRFVSAPPFPEFRVISSSGARPPVGAWDDHGRDVLPLLSQLDRKYVADFESIPYAGFARLHSLELDLGAWDPQRPLRLLLDGYTDYFTATSMYAGDQANIKVIAPYVEALDAQGRWTRVVEDMGFPAGLARTMVADLSGKLPPGTRRIRIVTNLKIYWDQVRIDATPEPQPSHVTEVPLASAALDFLGYPREIRGNPASDTWYSYAHLSLTGPYARAAGNYTRFGDVRDLLRTSDDRFVVFGSGEGVRLEFDPHTLPSLPNGWVRDYFFFADGFEKDLDFYAAHAFTVEPLPHHGLLAYPYPADAEYPLDEDHLRYQLEYNTRSRSERLPPVLRYSYPALH
jgi:tetratricopeptide (TPR) repeat protein